MPERRWTNDQALRRAAAHGLAAVADRFGGPTPELAVLTYHRVAPIGARRDLHPGLAVPVDAFAEQMAWLAARGGAVSIEEVVAACSGGPALRPGSVLVTFDDAYTDVAEHAWPILQRYGVPAVLFVPTAYPDANRSFWWDSLYASLVQTRARFLDLSCGRFDVGSPAAVRSTFRSLRGEVVARRHGEGMDLVAEVLLATEASQARPAVMGWSEIARLAQEGLGMAPHSRSHPRLDRIEGWKVDDEVLGSYEDLRRRLPRVAPAFAYPGGGHGAAVRTAAADAGIAVGFTTERGVNPTVTADPLSLARVNVGPTTSVAMLRAQLSPRTHALVQAAGRARPGTSPNPSRQLRSIQWS